MRNRILATMLALAITLTATAAFAASKACYSGGKAYVAADVIAGISTATGDVVLLCPENNWGKNANTAEFVMTKEADGRYSISESKFKTGEGHPARMKTGRAANSDWPNNYAWSNATPSTKHLEFQENCQ